MREAMRCMLALMPTEMAPGVVEFVRKEDMTCAVRKLTTLSLDLSSGGSGYTLILFIGQNWIQWS